jgi:hypothetical protein
LTNIFERFNFSEAKQNFLTGNKCSKQLKILIQQVVVLLISCQIRT